VAFYQERAAFYHEKDCFGYFIRFRYFQSFVAFYQERAAFYHEKDCFGHFIRFRYF